MRLLDLFAGAGGCSVGYERAGFDVLGIDIEDHPDYPGAFLRADAMDVLADRAFLDRFDIVHASPPCQRYSKASRHEWREDRPDLVGPVRAALEAWGGPYVIENVPGAPLRSDFLLCGSMFGLGVRRHRLFETNVPVFALHPPCDHSRRVVRVFGKPMIADARRIWSEAMGIDWMRVEDLAQAIPPAYTEWLGGLLLSELGAGRSGSIFDDASMPALVEASGRVA